MYLNSANMSECFGCFACVDACPQKAIRPKYLEDTFLYPVIDRDNCINCKACENVCPNNTEINLVDPITCFSGIIKDEDSFKKCSSGGAFEAIVRAIYQCKKGEFDVYVAGAIWDKDFKVIHSVLKYDGKDCLRPLYKSKYAQSDLRGIYLEIKNLLKNDNYVIFSGTPCQVSALKSFLKIEYMNLFTIDLICRGAPSQQFFDEYKNELEREYGSKLVSYFFRNKEILDNGTLYTRSAYYQFENGLVIKATRFNDSFLKTFYEKSYMIRESCISCIFKQKKRIGDITIGDAWGIEKIFPEINAIRGVSVLIFNTERSVDLISKLYDIMNVYECDYDFICSNNGGILESSN